MRRRQVLAGLGTALAAAPLAACALPARALAAPAGGVTAEWVAAVADAAGRPLFAGLTPDGDRAFELALPARGHGAARHPLLPLCVVFARRPGRFALVVDLATGAIRHRIDSVSGRHFFGHGLFSPDGRLLLATENDMDRGVGVIGLYDATERFRRVGELPSHGIDPHDMRLLADGRTLVVANGGILTHPDYGRTKLNLPTMDPSLAYVDARDGSLKGALRLAPDLHQLSIRHLGVAADDTVLVAMQWEGPEARTVPIAALHRPGRPELELLEAPADLARTLRNYGGSATLDLAGGIAAVSAPRGNAVCFWSVADGRFLGHAPVPDGCGIAPARRAGELRLSSGTGGVYRWQAGRLDRITSPYADARRWDNHLVRVAT